MDTKVYDDEGYPGEWLTSDNGEHYFIREGETPKEAWERHLAKLKSKTTEQLKDEISVRLPKDEIMIANAEEKPKKDNPTSETIVVVDMDAEVQKRFDHATPKERQEIAFDYIMKNLRGKYPTEDGREVLIERVGAKKITHDHGEVKIRVVPALGELIQAGEFIEAKDANHKKFVGFAYYKANFMVGNETYTAVLNIGIRANGDSTLYDINQFKKKK